MVISQAQRYCELQRQESRVTIRPCDSQALDIPERPDRHEGIEQSESQSGSFQLF